ncbi:MAG TPA: adenosylmethionine--8-amino-7-oxononanoate transaminase [Chitinophagaceae bacterium]|nr:adenosylmethionine--8-amino-7-oxononanoate transaminase [Chitinophagaceae bacterium]
MLNLQEKDSRYIWHPYTQQKNRPAPIPIVRGQGSLLFDEAGNSYIDAVSSWWVTIHGHAHPYIAERIYRQAMELEQVIFTGFTHRPAVELAERLLKILPGSFSKVFYSDNGSTAVEVALKMAIQYWWNKAPGARKKIVVLAGSYHGDTFGSMSVSGRSVFTAAFNDFLFDVITIPAPGKSNLEEIKHTLLQYNDIAAFIYEPLLQGAGGMNMYEAACLEELLSFIRSQQILCIADEVLTGFGRTGKLFASESMNIKPDIICLSKGLTGGTMALGVTACTEKIYNAYLSDDRTKTFFHGHSFTANPLACTAALASMDLLLKEECLKSIAAISGKQRQFTEMLRSYPVVKDPRSIGTILAFEWDEGNNSYLNTVSQRVTSFMLERGIYLRPLGNTVYIMPPYCITEEELQKVYDALITLIRSQ